MFAAIVSRITKIMTLEELLEYLREVGYDVAEYLSEEEIAALYWGGEGAAVLGLVGEADMDDAGRILRGVDPGDLASDRLVVREPPPSSNRKRVMGFELSFAPMKSVSALWAIGDDEVRAQIGEAIEEALAAAMAVLEVRVPYARLGSAEHRRWERGDGLIWMKVRHESSRAGDPQLHDHVLIANLVRSGDRWGALDGQLLFDARPLAASAYGRTLQRALTARLGVAWTTPAKHDRGVREIVGVPEVLCDLWSKRHAEIEAAASKIAASRQRDGAGQVIQPGGAARRVASTNTRATKNLSETRAEKRARARIEAIAAVAAGRARGDAAIPSGVAAAVAAALWREVGGDVDRFEAAGEAAVGMAEIPEFNGAAQQAGLLGARRGGPQLAPERLAGVVLTELLADRDGQGPIATHGLERLWRAATVAAGYSADGLDGVVAGTLRRAQLAEAWNPQRAARAAAQSITDWLTIWDHDELVTTLLEEEPDASFAALEELARDIEDGWLDLVEGIAVAAPGGGPDGRRRRPGWQRWATAETLRRERYVFDWWAAASHQRQPSRLNDRQAAAICRAQGLTDEQTQAALGLYRRRGGVLSAAAGTGKTTTMKGVAALAAADGRPAVALAVGERATQELAQGAGIPGHNIALALTPSRRLRDPRRIAERAKQIDLLDEALPVGGCWIIDEASMADTVALHELAWLATKRDAQVHLTGDPAQLDAIGPGGVFGALVARDDIPTETLTEVHRYIADWYEQAAQQLRDGNATTAIDLFERRGRMVGAGDEDPITEIADMWAAAVAEKAPILTNETSAGVARIATLRAHMRDAARKTIAAEHGVAEEQINETELDGADQINDMLIVAATNAEVDTLNTALRDVANPPPTDPPHPPRRGRPRRTRTDSVEVPWIDDYDNAHTWTFRLGDLVQTTHTTGRIRTTKDIPIANGRRWRITAISGNRLKLDSIEGQGTVELPAKYWQQRRHHKTGRPFLQHGYASTLHRYQGLTADVALCLSSPHMDRPRLYVAMSRGRWGTYLVGPGNDNDVTADALAAHNRPGHTTAAAEAHRLGQAAGGLTPNQAAAAAHETPPEPPPEPPPRRTGPPLGF